MTYTLTITPKAGTPTTTTYATLADAETALMGTFFRTDIRRVDLNENGRRINGWYA